MPAMFSQPCAAATSQTVTLPPLPELFDPNFLDVLVPVVQNLAPDPTETQIKEVTPNVMMDTLRSFAHRKLTANCAPTFGSTGVPTLDAYLNIRTGIFGAQIDHHLEKAWLEDPNLTLRIIWSIRSIHDGKAEKELFYRVFGWLFKNHPRTAITNLHCLIDPVCVGSNKHAEKNLGKSHGYWKDLLNILALATVDELTSEPLIPHSNFLHNYCGNQPSFKSNQEQEEWSRAQRIKRSHSAHNRLQWKLLHDKNYRALYVAVARLFASQLVKEYEVMSKIAALPADVNKKMALVRALTLITKWAPTPGGSHDRVTNIASAICLLLHEARVFSPVIDGISSSVSVSQQASEMHILRRLYQKHILTPGRRYTCVPEPLMSSNRWSEIDYSRVPSICMKNNKGNFLHHDEERFVGYLADVESGKKKISGVTLLPHLLAMESMKLFHQKGRTDGSSSRSITGAVRGRTSQAAEAESRVVDAQWSTLVSRLRESGQLDNCIAVCDVSGSMGSLRECSRVGSVFNVRPIWPAISLSLLVARLAKPPFNDSFITFSASPDFVTINPESKQVSLGATIDQMSRANWEMNTDFNAVFLKLILPLAVQHNVPKDQMIKRIFVFSDMQFDAACQQRHPAIIPEYSSTEWKTNHDVVVEAYAQAGYDVPELVYWDLSNPRDGHGITAPVTGKREGVALLSGYSPSLLKLFMDTEEEWEVIDEKGRPERQSLTPEGLMKKALARKSFDGLVVVD